MSDRTVADLIVQTIADTGARHVFGVVGDALNPVTDAVRRHDGVDWIGVRHEETGAFAAGAQAQLTGTLGVCAGTVGPGALHLINGLYDAAKSHAPVLAIAGQVPVADMGTNYFQEVNFERLFADVACYTHTVTDAGQLPFVLAEAIRSAYAHSGVAVLTLPADMGSKDAPDDAPAPALLARPDPIDPDDDAIARAVELLEAADTVALLVGIGARGARDEVIRLADHLAAPMVVTLKGKEVFDGDDNPFQLGQTALIGNPAAHDALESSDLVLMIGTDFPYREWYPEDVPLVQIDIAADRIGRRAPVQHGVVGDAAVAVGQLLERVAKKDVRGHLDKHREQYLEWRERQQRLADPDFDDSLRGKARGAVDNRDDRIRPEAVAAVIDELAAPDAIFTADTGMSVVWMSRFIDFDRDRRALGSFNHGSMANALPQAIGASLLDRDRQVIALCGDGGFTMLMGDLLTAVSYDLPITFVIFDNGRLGMVKLEQEQVGLPEYGTVLDNPDLAEVARAMGAGGIRVEDPADLREALADALRRDEPVVVDVVTNPNEVALPPELTVSDATGFAFAKVKEFFTSRGEPEHLDG